AVACVVWADGGQVVALARRSDESEPALARRETGREVRARRGRPQRVEQAHGLPPVTHRARRVGDNRLTEGVGRPLVPERVQQRHRPLEARPRLGGTRDRKHDAPDGLAVTLVDLLGREPTDQSEPEHDGGGQPGTRAHGRLMCMIPRLSSTATDEAFAAVDRKSTRLNSSHEWISYAVFCLN